MAKEEAAHKPADNSFGVVSVVFGVLSVISSVVMVPGLILGILGLVFGFIQRSKSKNKWALYGIILSIAGIILSALILWWTISFVHNLQNTIQACMANPSLPGCESFASAFPQANLTS